MKESIEKWLQNIVPWLLSHGIKIVLILVGAYVVNKVIGKFIEKAVRIAVAPDRNSISSTGYPSGEIIVGVATTFFCGFYKIFAFNLLYYSL